ncbi:MAG: hypothetical protein WCK29_04565 [archaeon]
MAGNIRKTALFVAILLVFSGLIYLVSASDTMTVEANIISSNNVSIISVEVPDYLFFGNVSNGGTSEELKVYINNTGNVDISVAPQLINSSEQIFDNLYFRKYKTSNGSAVPFSRIGSFNIDVTKNASAYFYVILDLSNYTGTNNIMGHRTNVKFIATQK